MGNDQWYSVEQILTLMEGLSRNKLGTLRLSDGDKTLVLKSAKAAPVTAAAPVPAGTASQAAAGQDWDPELVERQEAGQVVASPIVGTFYAAPAPEKPPFVQVGQQVKTGDVLFIIESMKLMNEVVSEYDGTVAEVYVENGQPVEYGQPILRVE